MVRFLARGRHHPAAAAAQRVGRLGTEPERRHGMVAGGGVARWRRGVQWLERWMRCSGDFCIKLVLFKFRLYVTIALSVLLVGSP